MAKSKQYYIRKTHRYLGVILGIQFLIWTISGLYFSWSNIDEIHGDFQRRQPPALTGSVSMVSPDAVFRKAGYVVDSIHSIQVVPITGRPFYHLQFFSGGTLKKVLADATTGAVRPPITKEEAIRIAAESFNDVPELLSVEYIPSTDGHHEYRDKPLPAWAVQFKHPSNTSVYVSAEGGRVESFRNDKWRLFDFLWMGHTMDYKSRDNINNTLLRVFSAFGLFTVLSGFILFVASSRWRKRRKRSKRVDVVPA